MVTVISDRELGADPSPAAARDALAAGPAPAARPCGGGGGGRYLRRAGAEGGQGKAAAAGSGGDGVPAAGQPVGAAARALLGGGHSA